jgi:hypothetical protein
MLTGLAGLPIVVGVDRVCVAEIDPEDCICSWMLPLIRFQAASDLLKRILSSFKKFVSGSSSFLPISISFSQRFLL